MTSATRNHRLLRATLLTLGVGSVPTAASAQVTFSIDWHSPTVGVSDTCTGIPITEGDVLTPASGGPAFGPLLPPCTAISGGAGGLGLAFHSACVGHVGGSICRVELDALSYGGDARIGMTSASLGHYLFSTDEFAVGGVAPVMAPSVGTEAPFGDSSTDIWRTGAILPAGPLPPFAAPVGHVGSLDGNGLLSGSGSVYAGLGLVEPNFPGFPNFGDNVDAFDVNEAFGTGGFPSTGVYYSLDADFIDPITGTPNEGTGLGNGATGADVLVSVAPSGPPAIWAPAPLLGLNIAGGEDDLDALALWENGNGSFDPSSTPGDWMIAGGPDMLLFSVRRGSPVIGMPDSIFGIPITEGDILTTPLPTGSGGVSPFPGIFCAAENIGLSTIRFTGGSPDDLNALDTLAAAITDCNGNGVEDSIDLGMGTSTDLNTNGIPDDCELISSTSCLCTLAVAPCGNAYPLAGCLNSTGAGAVLSASGTGSVFSDDLILDASQMPATVPSLFFAGTFAVGPFPLGDGLRCAGGNIIRLGSPALTTALGTRTIGPGLAGSFGFVPFETWHFQCWFRDSSGPCLNGSNTTNSTIVTFTP